MRACFRIGRFGSILETSCAATSLFPAARTLRTSPGSRKENSMLSPSSSWSSSRASRGAYPYRGRGTGGGYGFPPAVKAGTPSRSTVGAWSPRELGGLVRRSQLRAGATGEPHANAAMSSRSAASSALSVFPREFRPSAPLTTQRCASRAIGRLRSETFGVRRGRR